MQTKSRHRCMAGHSSMKAQLRPIAPSLIRIRIHWNRNAWSRTINGPMLFNSAQPSATSRPLSSQPPALPAGLSMCAQERALAIACLLASTEQNREADKAGPAQHQKERKKERKNYAQRCGLRKGMGSGESLPPLPAVCSASAQARCIPFLNPRPRA